MRNSVLLASFFLLSIFRCLGQQYHDVVMTEIMVDPTPPAGLPEVEYVEMYNRSNKSISLKNWKLSIGTRSVILPDSSLLPGSYVILCPSKSLPVMAEFGKCIGLSSLVLPNDEAVLSIYNAQQQLVYSMVYKAAFWPAENRSGGYALEMIDVDNPCGGRENWIVSNDVRGGSPGYENSVHANVNDILPPVLLRADVVSENEVVLVFSKRLDSLNAVKGAGIVLQSGSVLSRKLNEPGFTELTIRLNSVLKPGLQYVIVIENLADCAGNILRRTSVNVGLPQNVELGDIVISEILFNPKLNGVDYVELHNNSGKFLSLKNWSLANLKSGKPDVTRLITTQNIVVAPHGFIALSTDSDIVMQQYPGDVDRKFYDMPSMPAFSNEQGGVVLLNSNLEIADVFAYTEKMHHVLLADYKGVSLEKIDYSLPAKNNSNWQSAASVAGYGTPGYANSQAVSPGSPDEFFIDPEVITPDQDGSDDVAGITYTQSVSGRIASIRVFDVTGNLVKNLILNQLIGTGGMISWDGTDVYGKTVKTGYYLVLIDTFDINGSKHQFKKRLVVASK